MGASNSVSIKLAGGVIMSHEAHFKTAQNIDELAEKIRLDIMNPALSFSNSKSNLKTLDKEIIALRESIVVRLRHLYAIQRELLGIGDAPFELSMKDSILLGQYAEDTHRAINASPLRLISSEKVGAMMVSLMRQVRNLEHMVIQHHIDRVSIPPAPPAPPVRPSEPVVNLVKRRRAIRLREERVQRAARAQRAADEHVRAPRAIGRPPKAPEGKAARAMRATRMHVAARQLAEQQNELSK